MEINGTLTAVVYSGVSCHDSQSFYNFMKYSFCNVIQFFSYCQSLFIYVNMEEMLCIVGIMFYIHILSAVQRYGKVSDAMWLDVTANSTIKTC